MADTFGLGSLFQEEGPGRTGAPRLLPVIDAPPFIREVDDDRSFGDYFQSDKNVVDRVKEYFEPTYEQGSFGSFQRDDGRVVRFGLPEEFSQEEILRALEDIKNVPAGSTLADRKDVAEVAKRLEGLPEDDPIFAESPLDALSADIDKTLADLKTTPSQTQKTAITALAQLNQEVAEDEMGRGISDQVVEDAFVAGMDDFLEAIRGAGPDTPKVKDIDEYKKEFAKATGIDISGKVDKSNALMAFGLALMQNKAGRGFNVGKMLASVGEAGTAALPALEKAKAQARNDAIAAGKYALEARSADETKAAAAREKAMERSGYYVVPRSEDVKGFLAGISEGRGRLEQLSKYEVDKLQNNPEFKKKFDILPGSAWSSIVEEAMKTPEAKDMYLTTGRDIPLIPDIEDDLFKIRVFDAHPNKNPGGQALMSGDGQQQYEALARMARDNEKAKQKFVELGVLNEGTNILRYSIDSLDSLLSAFGLPFQENEPESMKMKRILTAMAAKEAPRILGESGKTISDGDRDRVKDIVGDITATSDPRQLQAKFESLFNEIILGREADIKQALSTLNRYSGRNIGEALGKGDLNEEEAKELADALKGWGLT